MKIPGASEAGPGEEGPPQRREHSPDALTSGFGPPEQEGTNSAVLTTQFVALCGGTVERPARSGGPAYDWDPALAALLGTRCTCAGQAD